MLLKKRPDSHIIHDNVTAERGVGGMIFAPLLAVTIMQVTPGRERGDTPEIP